MARQQESLATILLEGMTFWGRHGVLPEERRFGGPFRVDLEVAVTVPRRPRDRMSETVDYRALHADVRRLMEGTRFRTMEALAGRLADRLARHPRVKTVRVRVTKLAPPLGGRATSAVRVTRP